MTRRKKTTLFPLTLIALLGVGAMPVQVYAQSESEIPRATTRSQIGASDVIAGLTQGDVYIVPSLRNDIDAGAVQAAIDNVRPTRVKVLAVTSLGNYRSRAALASDLRRRLNLSDDAIFLVATPRGISGVSGRLSSSQIDRAFQQAGVDTAFAQNGLTGAIVAAVASLSGTVVADRNTDTAGGAGVLFLIVGGVGAFVAYQAWRRKRELDAVREPLEEQRQNALEQLSYVDGYLDLLPPGPDTESARRLRATAFEKFDTATGLLQAAKAPVELRGVQELLTGALSDLKQCREAIDRATGGTGVAIGFPEVPRLETSQSRAERYRRVEEIETAREREALQREIEALPPEQRGVSFFSGRPMPADELVPVTIVVQGQKRTVMATRDEAEMIQRGETPAIRSFRDESGRYIPWYEYRGYDPYRDYYTGFGGLIVASAMVNLLTLSTLWGSGIYGGYGPWGYGGIGWGMPVPMGGWGYGYGGSQYDAPVAAGGQFMQDATPEHSGGMDFFGSNYDEHSGSGFDGGMDFDAGGSDFGGGDFDAGGGDW